MIEVVDMLTDQRVELRRNQRIVITVGRKKFDISTSDGKIMIQVDGQIAVVPRAANMVYVGVLNDR